MVIAIPIQYSVSAFVRKVVERDGENKRWKKGNKGRKEGREGGRKEERKEDLTLED